MKKVIASIIIILISILSMVNYVYAAEQLQATINIEPDKVEVSAGDKVTFTFTTKNIANAEYGKIYAIEGVIEYDENFFVYDSGLEVGETGKFNSTTPVSEGGTNGTITLKVIDNPTGNGVVKFTELAAGDGRLEDSETLGVAITANQEIIITLKQETPTPGEGEGNETPDPTPGEGEGNETPDPTPGEGEGNETPDPTPGEDEGGQTPDPTPGEGEGEQTPDPTPGEEDGNQNPEPTPGEGEGDKKPDPKPSDEKDNTTADKEIPKAGISSMVIISITIIGIIAIVMHRKNKKYQDIR